MRSRFLTIVLALGLIAGCHKSDESDPVNEINNQSPPPPPTTTKEIDIDMGEGNYKKYDIIKNCCKFECEPDVFIPVDLVSGGQEDLDQNNIRIVKGKWKEIWPSTLNFLKEMRIKHDFDTSFTLASVRVKLMLADSVMSEDADWEVSFTISEDGYGEWGVAYNGSEIDPDSSQPYF